MDSRATHQTVVHRLWGQGESLEFPKWPGASGRVKTSFLDQKHLHRQRGLPCKTKRLPLLIGLLHLGKWPCQDSCCLDLTKLCLSVITGTGSVPCTSGQCLLITGKCHYKKKLRMLAGISRLIHWNLGVHKFWTGWKNDMQQAPVRYHCSNVFSAYVKRRICSTALRIASAS